MFSRTENVADTGTRVFARKMSGLEREKERSFPIIERFDFYVPPLLLFSRMRALLEAIAVHSPLSPCDEPCYEA